MRHSIIWHQRRHGENAHYDQQAGVVTGFHFIRSSTSILSLSPSHCRFILSITQKMSFFVCTLMVGNDFMVLWIHSLTIGHIGPTISTFMLNVLACRWEIETSFVSAQQKINVTKCIYMKKNPHIQFGLNANGIYVKKFFVDFFCVLKNAA